MSHNCLRQPSGFGRSQGVGTGVRGDASSRAGLEREKSLVCVCVRERERGGEGGDELAALDRLSFFLGCVSFLALQRRRK